MILLRDFFGFRRRRRVPTFLFVVLGSFACLSGVLLGVIGLPFSFYRAWEVAGLPRPRPEQLQATTAGLKVLVTAQLPSTTATIEHGLILYYVEERQRGSQSEREARETPSNASAGWRLEEAPPSSFEVFLTDGSPLTLQLPRQTSFLNAQRVEMGDPPAGETQPQRRYVGYIPGQTVTVEGTWEGQHGLTATAIYAGLPEEYLNYLRFTRPFQSLVGAVCCSLLGLALIGGGIVWRIVG